MIDIFLQGALKEKVAFIAGASSDVNLGSLSTWPNGPLMLALLVAAESGS